MRLRSEGRALLVVKYIKCPKMRLGAMKTEEKVRVLPMEPLGTLIMINSKSPRGYHSF